MNPIEKGNIPARYVSLPAGNCIMNHQVFQQQMLWVDGWASPGPKSSSRHRYFLEREGYQHVPWEKMGNTWGTYMNMTS